MSDANDLTAPEKEILEQYDPWLKDGGPAALVIREFLEPVEGPDGVFFPATYAAEQGSDPDRFRGGYNIDSFPDGTNVCLIDSVGSQANRMEALFLQGKYKNLVPQVVVKAGTRNVNLLEAGHRAGDAIVRSSELSGKIELAFRDRLRGNAEPLAKIAPTSLVFGVWDSRGTQDKLPRLISSTIRAFNVLRHTRHAQYNPVINYTKEGLLDGINVSDDELAQKGYVSQPIGRQPGKPDTTHGGVQLVKNENMQGFLRRDATLGLTPVRRLSVLNQDGSEDLAASERLRRYVFGLALVALTAEQDTYFRQGCNLVPSEEGVSRSFTIVHSNGKRDSCKITHEIAKDYADVAAKAFVVGPSFEVDFRKELVEKDIKGEEQKLKGEVVSSDSAAKSFKLKMRGKKQKEVELVTDDKTLFITGEAPSTFEAVIVSGAKIDVEVTNGLVVKVTGKK